MVIRQDNPTGFVAGYISSSHTCKHAAPLLLSGRETRNICILIRHIDHDAFKMLPKQPFVFSMMNIMLNTNAERLFELISALWHRQLLLTAKKEALGKKWVRLN